MPFSPEEMDDARLMIIAIINGLRNCELVEAASDLLDGVFADIERDVSDYDMRCKIRLVANVGHQWWIRLRADTATRNDKHVQDLLTRFGDLFVEARR